jgi:hypothetical protein
MGAVDPILKFVLNEPPETRRQLNTVYQIEIAVAVVIVALALGVVAIRLVRGAAAQITVDAAYLTVHLDLVDKVLAMRAATFGFHSPACRASKWSTGR